MVSHVIAMRDKMGNMMELVKENVTQSQTGQKRWYDQKARHREFQKGDQVLACFRHRPTHCWLSGKDPMQSCVG